MAYYVSSNIKLILGSHESEIRYRMNTRLLNSSSINLPSSNVSAITYCMIAQNISRGSQVLLMGAKLVLNIWLSKEAGVTWFL